VAKHDRVVVYDPQLDWAAKGFSGCNSLSALARVLLDKAAQPLKFTFAGRVRDPALFGDFCRLVGAWARLEPATIVVEELAWSTSPGKAPAGWHELVTGALKYGVNLVSITQRPQESDKTALSQADIVRCFALDRPTDQKYMAGEMGIDAAELAALQPLHYVEFDRRARKIARGKLTF
jgi:hypothetical protein